MTVSSDWESQKKYDVGEINALNESLFRARRIPGSSAFSELAKLFQDKYSYDVSWGNGPYLATVLKVLSGPQVKNKAETKGMLSKSMNLEGLFSAPLAEKMRSAKKTLVRVIAKVPNFDVDIKWPKSEADIMRITAHGEYYAMTDDKSYDAITKGANIWITFTNTENASSGLDGRPAGVIIGVHAPSATKDIAKIIKPKKVFNPECQTPTIDMGPDTEGGLYAGTTLANVPSPPVPIRSIKGKIKTGIYGNGTPQTKAHFTNALKSVHVPKGIRPTLSRGMPGPAPGPENAFIWVGHLKNNGYLDILDRPITPGRETIIYASKMTDVNAPIEIKYYLHDDGGFGHSWLYGPNTTVEQASEVGAFNDFEQKVAPAIKDLIREKRNFVLVIPEMLFSLGFGTPSTAGIWVESIRKNNRGTREWRGVPQAQTIRTKAHPLEAMPQINTYLSSLSSKFNEDLSAITRLYEREFSTFDGSVTGGNFEYFHGEVLQVLKNYLGMDPDRAEYVSILADGLSAITMASIASPKHGDSTHEKGQRAFRNLPISRIDFIDTGIDGQAYYNFERTPPYEFYKNYMEYVAPTRVGNKLEMNYISSPSPLPGSGARKFFEGLGKGADYTAALNNSLEGAKFLHSVPGYPDTSVTFHLTGQDPALYAFSMINNLNTSQNPPLKKISSHSFPVVSAIPNHAEAMASKSESAAAEQYQAETYRLREDIANFSEEILGDIAENGIDVLCNVGHVGRAYCSSVTPGVVVYSNGSLFHKNYIKWLDNIKRYIELNDPEFGLIPFHISLKEQITTRSLVQNKLNSVNSSFLEKKASMDQAGQLDDLTMWKDVFTKEFIPDLYNNYELFEINVGSFASYSALEGAMEFTGQLAGYARFHAELDALQKQISALNDKRGRLEITGDPPQISADCEQTPGTLEEQAAPALISNLAPFSPSKPGAIKCDDASGASTSVTRPDNFSELKEIIPYIPSKSDFFTDGGLKLVPTKKINIRKKVDNYKASSFNYLARASNAKGFKRKKSSVLVWSCLVKTLEDSWKYACEKSNYYPFAVSSGIRGSYKKRGQVAYPGGISIHAYGLAIDIDSFITGHRVGGFWPGVWTGAFTPRIGNVRELGWEEDFEGLGIFPYPAEWNKVNFGKTLNDAKKFYSEVSPAGGPFFPENPRFYRIKKMQNGNPVYKMPGSMRATKNSPKNVPIVGAGANPTAWIIHFCEKSGMKWCNSYFLKRRWDGQWKKADFSSNEKTKIDKIYNIAGTLPKGAVADRIKSISYAASGPAQKNTDASMKFQYYAGNSIIGWNEIK